MTTLSQHITDLDAENLTEAALQYADIGLPVLPLRPREKTPRPGTRGYKSATCDREAIQTWWASEPRGNIAISPGTGYCILDIDYRNGGAESFTKLIELIGELPMTPQVESGGGGQHYYFATPVGFSSKLKKNHPQFPGIDLLGSTSYAVAPPSIHPSGNRYRWVGGRSPLDIAFATAPTQLLDLYQGGQNVEGGISNSPPLPANDNFERSTMRLPKLDSILAGCEFMKHCQDDATTLPENHWYAMLGIVGKCENGREAAQRLSESYPGYCLHKTDSKLDHALETPPRTCENIESELGFLGCARCPFKAGDMTSPIALGYQDRAVVELGKSFVYDLSSIRFFHIVGDNPTPLLKQSFKDKFAHEFKGQPDAAFLRAKTSPKVDSIEYLPGNDRLIAHKGENVSALNLWRNGGVEPIEGDCSIINEHLSYIFPEEAFREYFVMLLAHLVQHPAIKVPATVLMGAQGIGKSWFRDLARLLFGNMNVRTLESDVFNSRFREVLGNIQVVFIEELMQKGRMETADFLKQWITDEVVRVEEKFVPNHPVNTFRALFAFSNHELPIYVYPDDRRWFTYHCRAEKKPDTYYTRLFTDGLAQASAFKHYLLNLDISRFNPKAAPPVTEAKLHMIRDSKTPLAREIGILIEDANGAFRRDLVTLDEVRGALCFGNLHRPESISKISDALRELGAVALDRQIRVRGERFRYWVIRNVDTWAKAAAEEIAAHVSATGRLPVVSFPGWGGREPVHDSESHVSLHPNQDQKQ